MTFEFVLPNQKVFQTLCTDLKQGVLITTLTPQTQRYIIFHFPTNITNK